MRKRLVLLVVILACFTLAFSFASCGGNGDEQETVKESETGEKLPPGVTEEELGQASYSGNAAGSGEEEQEAEEAQAEETAEGEQQVQSPGTCADLVGARFTIVEAPRKDSNDDVVQTGEREVKGDYLEIELEAENVGDDLIDLSHYSFRLESPGIEADLYQDYYGQVGTYGKYVDEDTISATLLDFGTLEAVDYIVKIGEVVDKVFLFFDLNPESVAKNEEVTRENTVLIIKKTGGSEYGEKVELSIAGYSD